MIINIPDFIAATKNNDISTLCIDDDIVDVIQSLWDHKIVTLGCCSGHGKENPSVIIADSYKKEDIKDIKRIINKSGNAKRKWKILQWSLINVA